jgi:hypothetical protein
MIDRSGGSAGNGETPHEKPEFALVGVEPDTLIVQQIGGWCMESIKLAAKHGLMPIRTTWARQKGLLFETLSEDQFMVLSA